MDLTGYCLRSEWRFDAPLAAVWDALLDAESWPAWWPGVECLATLDPGGASGLGASRLWLCRSALPFGLRFTTRVTCIDPLQRIEGLVEGELEGRGCCRLWREGNQTCVRHDWQVRTTPAWMTWTVRLLPIARPLFRWNHDALMRAGGRGLARRLQTAAAAQPSRPA